MLLAASFLETWEYCLEICGLNIRSVSGALTELFSCMPEPVNLVRSVCWILCCVPRYSLRLNKGVKYSSVSGSLRSTIRKDIAGLLKFRINVDFGTIRWGYRKEPLALFKLVDYIAFSLLFQHLEWLIWKFNLPLSREQCEIQLDK